MKKVFALNLFRQILILPIGILVRLWNLTFRLRGDKESIEILNKLDGPCVIFFWHNCLFVTPRMYKKFRAKKNFYALVSASKDGAWLSSFLRTFKIQSIRGSSSFRGSSALKALAQKIKQEKNFDIAITPDGPRGPRYKFKKGSISFFSKANIPVLFISFKFRNYWRLKSWDKFFIPKPFSVVKFKCQYYPSIKDWPTENITQKAEQILSNLHKHL